MNQQTTLAISLRRVDYSEADRIVTVLSPDLGKISILAKGVRRLKSKMAGGLELMALNELTVAKGKGNLYSLRSARMKKNFSAIVKSYENSQQAFSALKQINSLIEEGEGKTYFEMTETYLSALNENLPLELMELWWSLRLSNMLGHSPNLSEDTTGQKLKPDKDYLFDANAGAFTEVNSRSDNQQSSQEIIKLWRLCLQLAPASLTRVKNSNQLAKASIQPLRLFVANHT